MDIHQLDNYFNNHATGQTPNRSVLNRYTRIVKMIKLALPSLAAILICILLLYPYLKNDIRDFQLDLTLPQKGELEKLHVSNTTFYITDKDNKVSNFVASNIDETSPSSKLIKLTNPEGIIPQNNGLWINIKSPLGFFDQNKNLLELQQNVEVFYSDGINLNTSSAFFDFNTSRGYGNAPISGDGFLGNFKSQGFEIKTKEDLLILKGHTHITIKEESLKR